MLAPRHHWRSELSSAPSRIVAEDVAPTPGPVRRAVGWMLIVVSPVPVGFPVVALFQTWDRLGEANSPLWILPLVLLGYLGFTVALLCVGRGLVSGRTSLVINGGALFVGAFMVMFTLFSIFD